MKEERLNSGGTSISYVSENWWNITDVLKTKSISIDSRMFRLWYEYYDIALGL